MKNIIVGTAGHIDHGKTTLIRALTGKNTDRLKEEQKRGISIELGFTFFDLPSGLRAGIIDVPGHEKFIKNMLAGVIGMDVVILVVAADEGMMPQSIEHLQILNLLGIKKGFIALTKIDRVEEEWLELVEEETREKVKGTFLEDKDIVRVSSTTGEGLDKIKKEIDKIASQIEEDKLDDLPRLAVDRSFVIQGFGTVVTGTLLSGSLKLGDEVQIYPSDITTRIRSIQVHDNDVDTAYKGQRVALNLAGIKKDEAPRGSMIAPIDSMKPSRLLDVELKTIDLPYDISNRTRLRLYIGTQEVFCRVVLLERDGISSNQKAIAQLKLEDKVVAKKNDKFILRLFSPMITIGGGSVIDANPSKKKRYNEEDIELVELMGSGDSIDVTEAVIREHSKEFLNSKELAQLRAHPVDMIEDEIEKLEEAGKVFVIKLTKDTIAIHKEFMEKTIEKIAKEIGNYHKTYPIRQGMGKEEVRSKYFARAGKKVGELLIDIVVDNSKIEVKNEFLKLESFEIAYSPKQVEIMNKIMKEFESSLVSPKLEEIFKNDKTKKQDIQEVYNSLVASAKLTKLDEETTLNTENLNIAINKIIKYLKENNEISLAQARDILETNRKVSLSILEYLDKKEITERKGEARRLK